MKILQIMPRIPAPPNDGGAIYVFQITKHLALRGHDLVMASFESNRHEQKPEMLAPYGRVYSLPAHFKPYDIPSVVKSTLTRQPVSVQHRMDIDKMSKILSLIPNTSFDVILIEGIHSARFLEIVKKKYPQVPIILRQSNVEYLLLERNAQNANNFLLRQFFRDQARLMKRFEIDAMQSVDGVTAISEYDRQKFLELVPDLVCEVIPAGAELPGNRNITRDDQTLLAVSNWAWRPNMDGMMWFVQNVWPKLKMHYPYVKFELAGNGLTKSKQHLLEDSGISCLGFVDDIESYRQKATALVVPLFSGSGMKIKILEGLASGIPVVTTSIGAQGIEMQPGIDFLPAETVDEFLEQISRLIDDLDLRKKLSKSGILLIEQKYQWGSQAERLETFIKEIVERRES